MKTLPIPAHIEALLTHECPQLAELLRTTDGRLELERFAFLIVSDESEGSWLDVRIKNAYSEGFDTGFIEGQSDP